MISTRTGITRSHQETNNEAVVLARALIYRSDVICDIYGLPPEEFPRSFRETSKLIHPDDLEKVRETFAAASAAGRAYDLEYRIVRNDGEIRYVHELSDPEYDEDGTLVRSVGTFQDITERKRAEEALRKSEEKFRSLAEGSRQGLCIHRGWTPVFTNQAFADIYGFDNPEQVIASGSIEPFYAAHEIDRLLGYRAKRLKGEEAPEWYVCESRRRDGAVIWTEHSVRMIDWDGEPAVQCTVIDITERKRSENAMLASEERLRRSVLDAPIPIMMHAEGGEVLMISKKWTELSGYSHADIPTIFDWTEKAYGADRKHMKDLIGGLYEIEQPFEDEAYVTTVSGERRTWDFRTAPLGRLPDGRRFVISMAVDVTERRMAHDELEQRVEERTAELRAAQADLLRQERLATLGQLTAKVSHELRNPLGVIQTSTFIVRDNLKDCDPRVGRSLERIERSVIRCDRIIDELLDYTRIQQLEPEPTPIDTWLDGVLKEQTLHTDITLRRELGLPGVKVSLDHDRFRRAVINVFDNACQAMVGDGNGKIEEGEHILTIQTGKTNGRIEVVFKDNGPGIPPDVLPKIFEPMFSTKGFGVGLGLPVAQRIMEQHGGGIEIDSRQGRGTRTCLWLPSDHAVH